MRWVRVIPLRWWLAGAVVAAILVFAAETIGSDPFEAEHGFAGRSFAPVAAPSGEKPQSKAWYHDGSWWAALIDGATEDILFHRLNDDSQVWERTLTLVDERQRSHADVLSVGEELFVVSSGQDEDDPLDGARFRKYSYDRNTGSYDELPGYPTVITWHGVESIVITQDSVGRLWVTYAHDEKIWIVHADSEGAEWSTPAILPADSADNVAKDDISSIVAFDDRGRKSIGVLFSNQVEGAHVFAVHADDEPVDQWQTEVIIQGPGMADDHLNLRSLDDAAVGGYVLGVVKTSLNRPDDPLILLVYRTPDGVWNTSVFSTVAEQHTRPVLVVDSEHRQLHVFASSPCCSGGFIYRKSASLDDPKFDPGLGDVFIAIDDESKLNNPTSAKHPVDSSTGLLVIASDVADLQYAHGLLALEDGSVDLDTSIVSAPTRVSNLTTVDFAFRSTSDSAVFECRLASNVDARFLPCTSPVTLDGLGAGSHTFEVRAVDPSHPDVIDSSPASSSWYVASETFSDPFEVGLENWDIDSRGGASAELVRDPDGFRGSVAQFESDGTARTFVAATIPATVTDILVIEEEVRVEAEGVDGGHVRLFTLTDASGVAIAYAYRQNGSGRIWVQAGEDRIRTRGTINLGEWSDVQLEVTRIDDQRARVAMAIDGEPALAEAFLEMDTEAVTRLELGYRTTSQSYRMLVDALVLRS